MSAAGVEPTEIAYVGDSLDHDVAPAQSAGLRAIWLDRTGNGLPPGYEPDAVVRGLTYLPMVLTHLPLPAV